MKLYEKETKKILAKNDVKIPGNGKEEKVVKAQVFTTNRKERGGVKFTESREKAEKIGEKMRKTEIGGEKPQDILIEDQVEIEKEYYLNITYSTETRSPEIHFSTDGGTGVEDKEVVSRKIEDGEQYEFRELLEKTEIPNKEYVRLPRTLQKIFKVFIEEDLEFLEVNPLAKTEDSYIVVDALAETDDDAEFRHERDFPPRTEFSREKTEREKQAEEIDKEDHRGIAGKYTELEGDIGMMLAGGGASLTNMDALIEAGGQPANYTEYGGNPPTEKVYKLSKVIMSKPDLKGLLHVGGTANNTDIYRTMKGFVQALREEKPEYPIVIRRDGPNADKAFKLLRETREELDLDMELYRNQLPMTKAAQKLMEKIETQ